MTTIKQEWTDHRNGEFSISVFSNIWLDFCYHEFRGLEQAIFNSTPNIMAYYSDVVTKALQIGVPRQNGHG